jgi:hypothetical protein
MYSIWSLGLAVYLPYLHLLAVKLVTSPVSAERLKDDQVIRYEDLRSALRATRVPIIPQCMQ